MNQQQFDLAWLAWAAGTVGTFTGLELAAIRSGDHSNTLSAHLRNWFGIQPYQPREPYAIVGTVAFLGGCAWLGVHIAFEMWALPVDRWLGSTQRSVPVGLTAAADGEVYSQSPGVLL